jgi:Rhs element Vgr protein
VADSDFIHLAAMPESPSQSGRTVLGVTVESEGSPIAETIGILSVSVERGVNRIPKAILVLSDGDMTTNDFPVSASDTFVPGARIRISAGYDGSESPIFEGVVVRHGISATRTNLSTLVVECRDPAVAMTLARRNACYTDSKDSDVISGLVARYRGLSSDVVSTSQTQRKLIQHYCTDWDFLVSRAELNGFLTIVEDGKVTVAPPDAATEPELRVTWGQDLFAFEAGMDARWQRASMKGVGWSPKDQAAVEGEAQGVDLGLQGDLGSARLASALLASDPQEALQTPLPLEADTLSEWAKARQTRAELARVRGRMTFEGSAKARVGGRIELAGVGSRFEGKVFVGSVLHQIEAGSWTTEVEFGMDPFGFTERKDVMAPPAAGRTPGIAGLHVGVVRKLDENPDGEPMILVSIMSPGISDGDSGAVWARLVHPYASSSFGWFFIPEIGDEVVLGFLDDNPSHPVILGSVYSSSHEPPHPLTADNFTKAIVTRSKLTLEFDDEKKVVTVVTPAGNTIVLSDEDRSIVLADQHGNRAQLNQDGIRLESPADITLDAKGKITLNAVDNVEVSSTSDVKVSGLNIGCEAQVGFTGKGSATAELSASGQTTVKGAIVLIN